MRRFLLVLFSYLVLTIIIMPALLVRGVDWRGPAPVPDNRVEEEEGPGPVISVYLTQREELVEMPLEDYLVGVVAAEMPAQFEEEALKAQAVAARTFALRRMSLYGGTGCGRHEGADVCTDPTHCQGWLSKEELQEKWGLVNYPSFEGKITGAVSGTGGLILTHDNEVIDAAYHSTCGGHTEAAGDVWGREIPYLVGVPCPYDQDSPRYRDQISFPVSQVADRLGAEIAVPVAGGTGFDIDMEVIARSETGRVLELQAGDKTLTGGQVRERLELRSANFQWRLEGEELVFETLGYGHGVGLCQYGANGLAKEGRTFQDILEHYYTGVEIVGMGE